MSKTKIIKNQKLKITEFNNFNPTKHIFFINKN